MAIIKAERVGIQTYKGDVTGVNVSGYEKVAYNGIENSGY
ncbi:hypothetical protein Barb7_02377 [Bacteroidales bacterium Barb7]|nr:hypothetical protein Barb7_02377 [Bacteroidales bacterium Barb7]